MPLDRSRRPFLGDQDPYKAADALLRQGLDLATVAKAALREALLRNDPQPRVPNPRRALGALQRAAQVSGSAAAAAGTVELPPLRNATCDVRYDANLGLTRMLGRAEVKRTKKQLAPILDPRSWSCTGGVIGAAFLVTQEPDGKYVASTRLEEKKKMLGDPWGEEALLYEYARSEVASFENILRIKRFDVSPKEIIAEYELHDCLVCTFGMASAPGGLTVNQGYLKATPVDDPGWWAIEVLKKIQVRDLTPQDPGNRYDFGQWVNQTIGSALSQWVHDTSILSPAF